jgi:hypothetical protein
MDTGKLTRVLNIGLSLGVRRRGGAAAQYALVYNGTTTGVNFGSDASLDNLHYGAMTAETWVYSNTNHFGLIIGQTSGWASTGKWEMARNNTAWIARIHAQGASWTSASGSWVHLAMTYDNAGDKLIRLYGNGALIGASAGAATVADSSADNVVSSLAGNRLNGKVAWIRLSNIVRYTGAFTPPAIDEPPAIDANTVEQWNLNDGTGSTAVASVKPSTNNGAITGATWELLP